MIREDVVREMLARLERGEGIKRTAPELGVDYEIYQRLHPVIGEHDHGVVLDVLRAALACPVCGGNVSMVCPGCAGRIGGKRVTTRKWSQLKKAAQRPRPGRRKKQEPSV